MTKFDIDKISFDDEKTWNLICEGHTLGMFQCESPLVQQWLKKVKPRNIWELSVVIAGVRPGSLKSGAMDAYAAIKNGEQEPKDYKNPVIKAVLEDTNGQIIFQEQIMCLGSNLAWPDLPEQDRGVKVDTLRKAIGKKNQQKIIEIGKDFVQGCIRNGTSQEVADELFQVIQNAGRYAFNLSHSISYSHIAYKTAYLKAHYPLEFIATYLSYAREKLDKWEEIKNLVRDSQYFGIKVNPPNVNSKNLHFRITGGSIDFGLKHLKFFTSATAKLLEKLPPITDWRQLFSICFTDTYGSRMNSRTAKALIVSGAFSDLGIGRKVLLNFYNCCEGLTPKEQEFIESEMVKPEYDKITSFPILLLQYLDPNKPGRAALPKRKPIIQGMAQILNLTEADNASWIYNEEREHLGCPLTASSIDGKDITGSHTCYEANGDYPKNYKVSVAGVIEQVYMTTTKKGKNPGQQMARISISDNTGQIENLPVFPELFSEVSSLLAQRNTVLLDLYRNNQGWIVNSVKQI